MNNDLMMAVLLSSCLTGCATIFGGSKYVANVVVEHHPNASIVYNGKNRGNGNATFKINRRDANKVAIVVKEKGCETQVFNYNHRELRGWTLGTPIGISAGYSSFINLFARLDGANGAELTGLFVGNMIMLAGIPIGVDALTGAYWRPDISVEKGITRVDMNPMSFS